MIDRALRPVHGTQGVAVDSNINVSAVDANSNQENVDPNAGNDEHAAKENSNEQEVDSNDDDSSIIPSNVSAENTNKEDQNMRNDDANELIDDAQSQSIQPARRSRRLTAIDFEPNDLNSSVESTEQPATIDGSAQRAKSVDSAQPVEDEMQTTQGADRNENNATSAEQNETVCLCIFFLLFKKIKFYIFHIKIGSTNCIGYIEWFIQ